MPTLHCPLDLGLVVGCKSLFILLNSQESCRLQIPNFFSLFIPRSEWQLGTTGEQTGPSSFNSFLCPRESLFFSTKQSQVAVHFPQVLSSHICHICTPQLLWPGVTHPKWNERNSSTNPIWVVPCCLRCRAEPCLIADLISPWHLRSNNDTAPFAPAQGSWGISLAKWNIS